MGSIKEEIQRALKNSLILKKILELKDIKETGKDIRAGIIEFGIDKNHKDVKDNLSISIINDDNFPVSQHGTSVSDMVIKIAPRITISVLVPKERNVEKYSTIMEKSKNEKENYLIDALEKAKEKKVQFVNLSRDIGGNCSCNLYVCYKCKLTEAILDKIKELTDANILVVKSAGNEGNTSHETTEYYKSMMKFAKETDYKMILVGSLEYNYSGREYLSDYSVQATFYDDRFICAPGTDVLLATHHDEHDSISGTSFAAPAVSGALALLMEAFPECRNTPEEYIKLLLKTARKTDALNNKLGPQFGAGIMDIKAALKEGKDIMRFKKKKTALIASSKNPFHNKIISQMNIITWLI